MKIKSVKSLGVQKVYDVVGSETSNFMLDNGLVVHNSGVVDEANFLEVQDDSRKTQGERYDAAEDMHNAIMNRMSSRFMKGGIIPGMLVMISSPLYPDSFLERTIEQGKATGLENLNMFYRTRSTWEAKGEKYYPSFFRDGKFFEVDVDTLEILREVS